MTVWLPQHRTLTYAGWRWPRLTRPLPPLSRLGTVLTPAETAADIHQWKGPQ